MKKYEFVDLGINSTKFPFNTHLWWEHSTYGIIMVDSTDQTVLLHSTIDRLLVDGNDWSVVTDQVKNIVSGWLDGNDLWLLLCTFVPTGEVGDFDNEFTVIYIELDNSNNVVLVASSVGLGAGTVRAYDIFKIGSDHFVINFDFTGGTSRVRVWDVDADPFVQKAL